MGHSEILRVRYDQIDFDHRRIWIDKAKAGEREQPITQSLCDALRRQHPIAPENRGYVFPGRGKGKSSHRLSMARPFVRAVRRAGLDPTRATPHVMRHTAITSLVMAGADLPTIQR
ncbi:tyrosine-type recombinase/integrase [Sphingomonas sp.]|uniref:tyrosine-type recombinase/integrase n=1 Tax=Sphingomonas sp. TaxID=28214 RepID=UPI0025D4FBB0|nr:tyrosine-type recombinase/integrase [Sphingomonas sp.]